MECHTPLPPPDLAVSAPYLGTCQLLWVESLFLTIFTCWLPQLQGPAQQLSLTSSVAIWCLPQCSHLTCKHSPLHLLSWLPSVSPTRRAALQEQALCPFTSASQLLSSVPGTQQMLSKHFFHQLIRVSTLLNLQTMFLTISPVYYTTTTYLTTNGS